MIILGNSGGGKTSLLNILGTIDKLTKVANGDDVGKFRTIWGKDQIYNSRLSAFCAQAKLSGLCLSDLQPH